MNRLIRVYENIILYAIAALHFGVRCYFADKTQTDYANILIIETGIILSTLYIFREFVIKVRIKKYEAQKIVTRRRYVMVLRSFLVVLVLILMWMSIGTIASMSVIMIGSVLNYILPKPFSEGVFLSETGLIIKARYYDYSEINKVELLDSGDVVITCIDREERIAFHTKQQKKVIYNQLKERVGNGC